MGDDWGSSPAADYSSPAADYSSPSYDYSPAADYSSPAPDNTSPSNDYGGGNDYRFEVADHQDFGQTGWNAYNPSGENLHEDWPSIEVGEGNQREGYQHHEDHHEEHHHEEHHHEEHHHHHSRSSSGHSHHSRHSSPANPSPDDPQGEGYIPHNCPISPPQTIRVVVAGGGGSGPSVGRFGPAGSNRGQSEARRSRGGRRGGGPAAQRQSRERIPANKPCCGLF